MIERRAQEVPRKTAPHATPPTPEYIFASPTSHTCPRPRTRVPPATSSISKGIVVVFHLNFAALA
eukprot:scaffold7723_cov100-Isochrysis_galbana.AAC.6